MSSEQELSTPGSKLLTLDNDQEIEEKVLSLLPFAKYPIEIIENVLKSISIEDCRNVIQTYTSVIKEYNAAKISSVQTQRRKLVNAIDARTNIVLYLGNFFPNCQDLLRSMLINNVYLSGSRALQFFAGKGATESSDFDFYMPKHSSQNIINFMEYMKNNSITWHSTLTVLENKINSNEEEISISSSEKLYIRRLLLKNDTTKYPFNIFKQIVVSTSSSYSLTGTQVDHCNIINKNGINKKVIVSIFNYGDTGDIEIISGTLKSNQGNVPIQLILTESKNMYHSPLHTIVQFYMSAVQCFIGGGCAVHMYKSDVYNSSFTIWNTKYSKTKTGSTVTKKCIEKYIERGFKVNRYKDPLKLARENGRIKRTIGDLNCDIINYWNIPNLPDEVQDYNRFSGCPRYMYIEERKRIVYSFSWLEGNSQLHKNFYDTGRIHTILNISKHRFVQSIFSEIMKKIQNVNEDEIKSIIRNGINMTDLEEFDSNILNKFEQLYDETNIDKEYYKSFLPLTVQYI